MARRLALVALVLTVAHTTAVRADAQDEGSGMATGADLTGVDGSDQAVVPADVVPDPTVGSSRGQQTEPASGVWDRLAACESNERWDIVNPPYYGGLQFDLPSWRAAGGSGRPDQASRAEQIRVGQNWQRMRGWSAWPVCSRVVGLR